MGFVEEQAEIGEDHPEFLPAIAIFELSQQVSRKLVLKEMFADVSVPGPPATEGRPQASLCTLGRGRGASLTLPQCLAVQRAGKGWPSPALLVPSAP